MFGSPKLCATAARGERIAPFPRVPLAIGGIPLSNRVILAPMSGITDALFRRLVSRLGAGLVVSEMTASEALVAGQREARLRGLADAYGALAWRAAV
jgi:tRNA-dihydrouridine synthase B